MTTTKWPKPVAQLTPEQERIRDDWMKHFHEQLSDDYGAIPRFNHGYAAKSAVPGARTLEIGAGLAEYLDYAPATDYEYVALELREEMTAALRERHPEVEAVVGNAEERLPFDEDSFDRVLAIHVLEHLPNLPAAVLEIRRVLRPGGTLSVVLPCEGGFTYGIGRRFTSQRTFEKRYGQDFDPFIKAEHYNVPAEVIEELDRRFERTDATWWPLKVPTVHLNVCVGLTYVG